MNCPICGSSPISNWIFECRTVAVSRTSDYHVTAECIKIANSKLIHVASERDALQIRVTTLQVLWDQRWKMMRELEVVCGTEDVEKAVEYIKGLKSRVTDLEAALLPFAQIGDIANDPDCTIWKRAVSAGSVRLARGVLESKESKP